MPTKLHEILAVESTVVNAALKLMGETNQKFKASSEFLTGSLRTLQRVSQEPADLALQATQRKSKELVTSVPDTLEYALPYVVKALDVKHTKHLTNQVATADIVVDDEVLMARVPVDFLLDLEKTVPELRNTVLLAPTLDPSKRWVRNGKTSWKTEAPIDSPQTEKIFYGIELAAATERHAAQVKEGSKDVIVGTYSDMTFSGALTTLQKAEMLAYLDRLLIGVKQARMRANSIDVVRPAATAAALFDKLDALMKSE